MPPPADRWGNKYLKASQRTVPFFFTLQVSNAILEQHRADRNTGIQIARVVKVSHRSSDVGL